MQHWWPRYPSWADQGKHIESMSLRNTFIDISIYQDEVNECLEYNKDHQSTAPEFLEPDVFELQKTTGILELYDRISALRAMLRFLWRMMDSSGTADRLRNLVESSILSSLVSIISEPYVFGSNCFVSGMAKIEVIYNASLRR